MTFGHIRLCSEMVKDNPYEHYLRIGLLLLSNLIQGQDRLATRRSLHIDYSQCPERICELRQQAEGTPNRHECFETKRRCCKVLQVIGRQMTTKPFRIVVK
jgi:hypothetical protein